jgi:hypothetical protein
MSASSSASSMLAPLLRPTTGLPVAAAKRQFWEPLLFATAVGLLFAILAVPRLDFDRAAGEALDRAEGAAQMSPHEREEKIGTVRRVGTLATYAGAALGPALVALAGALALWLGFKVVGGKSPYVGAFTAMAWGLVPGAVESLLTIPALLTRSSLEPEAVSRLLPASLGVFLPASYTGPLANLLWSVDLFSLWAVFVVGVGMAGVAGVSRRRSLTTVIVLWVSFVAVFKVALPLLGGAR